MRNKIASLVPVVAVIALAVGCAPAATGAPTPTPAGSLAPTAAPPSVAAIASLALTETFSSTLHGISVSYPEGWVPRAATEPWPDGGIVQMESPFGDVIEDGSSGDTAFLAVGSQPLAGMPLDEWVADYGPFTECGSPEPVVVDGAPGVVGSDCPMALVAKGDRVFLSWLYRIDDPDWFAKILDTVKLDPEAALDAAP